MAPTSQRDSTILITYREFAPSAELGRYVRAYFSFAPGGPQRIGARPVTREVLVTRAESFDMPLLADPGTSLVLDLGATCHAGGGWASGTPLAARVIGAARAAGVPAVRVRSEMVGAYLQPGATLPLLDAPTGELTDRMVGLEDVWGNHTADLIGEIAELDEAARIVRLDAALLERLRPTAQHEPRVDVLGLATWVQSRPESMSVGRLADAAGVSRQHLARLFQQMVGVSPKRFCRLARFKAGLRYAGAGLGVKWAQVAAELGYADQSHMIAEFREFGGLTPEVLATRSWFHPFIAEARARFGQPAP